MKSAGALNTFIDFLRDNRMVNPSDITLKDWEGADKGFEARFRIQKLVYLAKHFGFEHKYDYGMYIYGPYSRDLATDYYKYEEHAPRSPLPRSFQSEDFLKFVKTRSNKWLELSVTLLDQKMKRSDEELLAHLEIIKSQYSMDDIRASFDDLRAKSLL